MNIQSNDYNELLNYIEDMPLPLNRRAKSLDKSEVLEEYKIYMESKDRPERRFVSKEVKICSAYENDLAIPGIHKKKMTVFYGKWKNHTNSGLFVRFGDNKDYNFLSLCVRDINDMVWHYRQLGFSHPKGILHIIKGNSLTLEDLSEAAKLTQKFSNSVERYFKK